MHRRFEWLRFVRYCFWHLCTSVLRFILRMLQPEVPQKPNQMEPETAAPRDLTNSDHVVSKQKQLVPGETVVICQAWIWTIYYDVHRKVCAGCFKVHKEKLRICSTCQLYAYCNKTCQKAHWVSAHKHECSIFQTMRTCLSDLGVKEPEESKDLDILARLILILTVLIKQKNGAAERHPGFNDKTPMDALRDSKITAKQRPDAAKIELYRKVISACFETPLWQVISEKELGDLYAQLDTNILSIFDVDADTQSGQGIYFEASSLSRACCDYNAVQTSQGPNIAFKAIRNFQYGSLKDVCFSGLAPHMSESPVPLLVRRVIYNPCHCAYCDDAYEAEANPMRCYTASCDEAIPMDKRAVDPCPKCGTTKNGPRLKAALAALGTFCTDYTGIFLKRSTTISRELKLLEAISKSGLIHANSMIRLACLCDAAKLSLNEGKITKAWECFEPIVPLARKHFQKQSPALAMFLRDVGTVALQYSSKYDRNDSAEVKLRAVAVLKLGIDYSKEAVEIFGLFYGPECTYVKEWEQQERQYMEQLKKTQKESRNTKSYQNRPACAIKKHR